MSLLCRLSVLLVLLGVSCSRPPTKVPPGTSLMLITLDTTRRDFISCYGADPRISPNLAAFAAQGTTFLDAYSQTNVTNPSHVTIMTGLTAIRHGIFDNFVSIPADLDVLPKAFRRAEYETAAFPATSHIWKHLNWEGFDRLELVDTEIDAREVTNRVLDWLEERRSDKPFFAWIHYWDPHSPYDAPSEIQTRFYQGDPFDDSGPKISDHEFFKKAVNGERLAQWVGDRRDPEYPRAMYAAEVHYMDRELGRLLKYLDETGLSQRTAVVVIADHGESLSEHGIFFSHSGLFETQLRIPFMARIPGFPSNLTAKAVVTHLDVAPTVSELFDVRLEHDLPGLSLVPLLNGSGSPELAARQNFIQESAHNNQVVHRSGRWKLIWPIMRHHPVLAPEPQLFDLQEDPDELDNLAPERADVVKQLARPLRPWISKKPIPKGQISVSDPETLERLKALGYVQ